MKAVARIVDLKVLEITVRHTRVTRTDDILLEVDSSDTANTLAEKMPLATAGKARMTRPERRTSVLLLHVPHWWRRWM